MFRIVAISLAIFAPPRSVATTTASSLSFIIDFNLFARIELAVNSSTGILKNPWICPACKSKVKILSAPEIVIKSATNLAVIGTLG